MKQFVNNDSDNQAYQPQTELVTGDEKGRSIPEKEGRAINFPLEIASSNQNSTAPSQMAGSQNFVTISTEKPQVMSFFDLSDVSMDHDDTNEQREMEMKGMKMTTEKQTAGPEIADECLFNGTTYKVCSSRFYLDNHRSLFRLKLMKFLTNESTLKKNMISITQSNHNHAYNRQSIARISRKNTAQSCG